MASLLSFPEAAIVAALGCILCQREPSDTVPHEASRLPRIEQWQRLPRCDCTRRVLTLFRRSPYANSDSGLFSLGLSTNVLPAAIAGAIFQAAST